MDILDRVVTIFLKKQHGVLELDRVENEGGLRRECLNSLRDGKKIAHKR